MHEAVLISFWITVALVAYLVAGYPLVVQALGNLRRSKSTTEPLNVSEVVLLVPACNEAATLCEKLNNALAINYPPDQLQIIVASDGSTDETVEIARQFENRGVRVLAFEKNRGKASVVNDSVREATGDVICLCDANVMFHPDALQRLVARLGDPGVGAVSGDVRLASHESDFGEGESFYYGLERALQLGESRVGSMMGVDGGMYVIRRELFQPLPPDTILDDFVLSMRVIQQGKRVVYEPTAVATENGTPSAGAEFQRRVRVAAGAVQSVKRGEWPPWWRPVELWQYVSHKLLRWLGPVWFVLLLVLNLLLWNEGVAYQACLAGQAALYLLAGLGAVSLKFRGSRIGGITFYFVMSHIAMGIGLIKGLLNRQRVTWSRTERSGQVAANADLTATGRQ